MKRTIYKRYRKGKRGGQHYHIGRKSYGSKLFREQIKKRLEMTVPSDKEVKETNIELLKRLKDGPYYDQKNFWKLSTTNMKHVLPKDIISFFEKNPEYLRRGEKVAWLTYADPEQQMVGESGFFSTPDEQNRPTNKPVIKIASYMKQKSNVPKTIRHELEHMGQYEDLGPEGFKQLASKSFNKSVFDGGATMETRKPWSDRPIEIDAMRRVRRLAERERIVPQRTISKSFRETFK